jgi:hypothetical protein
MATMAKYGALQASCRRAKLRYGAMSEQEKQGKEGKALHAELVGLLKTIQGMERAVPRNTAGGGNYRKK